MTTLRPASQPIARPVIGISADRRMLGAHAFHCVGEKYITAIAAGAGCLPLLIPALGSDIECEALLASVDGLLLTGSPSNVEPSRYQGASSAPGTLHDPHRDATTLPLIPRAIAAGIPILGICRGFQEMNVALGGTLHQKLHEVPGFNDHRDDETAPLEIQYGPAHQVMLTAGGWFAAWASVDRITVNSLHSQGIDRLAANLIVEARAPDGVVEAFRVADALAFAMAVQWHPEWQFSSNEFSRKLFTAFGAAATLRASKK